MSVAPALLAGPAIPPSSCAPDFSVCQVYENQITDFGGFLDASGDVIITSNIHTIGVFRIFNDVVDFGGGTGYGDFGFLYTAMFYNLPDPSTYSVNAVTVPLEPDLGNGFNETVYIGAFGTEYDIFTAVPEPATFGLLAVAGAAVLAHRRACKRFGSFGVAVGVAQYSEGVMNLTYRLGRTVTVSAGIVCLCAIPSFSQPGGQGYLDFAPNSIQVALKLSKTAGTGPKQQAGGGGAIAGSANANPSGGVQFYQANYTSFGKQNSFRIIGTDPSAGAAVTTVPTVIVPVKITFPNSVVLDGTNQPGDRNREFSPFPDRRLHHRRNRYRRHSIR